MESSPEDPIERLILALEALKDGNAELFLYIGIHFDEFAARRAVPLLIQSLQYKDLRVRRRSAYLLGIICSFEPVDDRAIEPLMKLLSVKDDELRFLAAWSLSWFRNKEVIAMLASLLNDESQLVRLAVAQGLGYIGGERAIEFLVSMSTTDSDDDVRNAAANAIALLK